MNLVQLKRLLSTPTAPFREEQIKTFFAEFFVAHRVPYFEDSYGNLVVGATDAKEYRRKIDRRDGAPLKIIVAHMDHPGFHAKSWISPNRLSFTWHGGSPTADLRGARFWISSSRTPRAIFTGRLEKPVLDRRGSALAKGEVVLNPQTAAALEGVPAKEIFGGFGFKSPAWKEGRIVYTKAADDLIGAFSVASVAADLYSRPSRDRDLFIGLLTRAEEVGFIGMIEHLERGYLKNAKRELVVLSLEASRTLERAKIGAGPVVRLGDRSGVFDPQWNQVLLQTARDTLKKKFQSRVMDGGTCEATTAIAYGIKAVGISVPLGNYHNMNFEGGSDASKKAKGPAPEFVNLDDVRGQIRLARAFVAAKSGVDPFAPMRAKFRKWAKEYRKLA